MKSRRIYLGAGLCLAAAHALVLGAIHSPVATSDILLDLCAALASLACYGRSQQVTGTARRKWQLIAASLFTWTVGQGLVTYSEGFIKLGQAPTALGSDFFFFLFGVPLLLTISSANESKSGRALIWIDGLQAAVAVYLIRLQLFSGVPGSAAQNAISALQVIHAYDVENFTLALTVTIRLLAGPHGEDKRLYRAMCLFLWSYAILARWLNHKAVVDHIGTGTWLDLIWDVPFLLLTVLVCWMGPDSETREALPAQSWVSLVITSGSPVFFTMALLVFGVWVTPAHYRSGIGAVLFALLSYGLRNAILQSRYMEAERKLLGSETALRNANQQLERLSLIDGLTGIPNRRQFDHVLGTEWERFQRFGTPFSLLVVDIDHFKLLNDTHGHIYGDECLITTAQELRRCLGSHDGFLSRYGGEEFTAVLPGVEERRALEWAEQMRTTVGALSIENRGAPGKRLTVSIGISVSTDRRAQQGRDLFVLADQALYCAKAEGRNRVQLNRFEGSDKSALGPRSNVVAVTAGAQSCAEVELG